jgi:hypothetical protein
MEPQDKIWRALAGQSAPYRFYANVEFHGCNWLLEASSADQYLRRAATTGRFPISAFWQPGRLAKDRSGQASAVL